MRINSFTKVARMVISELRKEQMQVTHRNQNPRPLEFGTRIDVGVTEYPLMDGGIPCPKFGTWHEQTYCTTMRFVTVDYCRTCGHHLNWKLDVPITDRPLTSIECGHGSWVMWVHEKFRLKHFEKCESVPPLSITKVEEKEIFNEQTYN